MDNIAHSLSAIVARDASPKRFFGSKVFLLISILAANLPDIDILFIIGGAEAYYKYHRGFTHSFFLIPVWGIIAALVGYYLSKKTLPLNVSWLWFSGFVALHDLMDWVTSYGTKLLWPLTDKAYTIDLFPIVDPILILTMALASIFAAIKPAKRRSIVSVFLILLSFYTCFRIFSKVTSEALVRAQSGLIEQIYSFPDTEEPSAWFNPSLYRVVAVTGKQASSYRVSPMNGKYELQGTYELLKPFDEHYAQIESYSLSRVFLKKSRLPVVALGENGLYFADLIYSGNVGQTSGLVLYFPTTDGTISGKPTMETLK